MAKKSKDEKPVAVGFWVPYYAWQIFLDRAKAANKTPSQLFMDLLQLPADK